MRRKKKDGDAEKAAPEQTKQAPLQPDFYDAQAAPAASHTDDSIGNVVARDEVRESAPSRPAPSPLPPIDDDNRWNRIDADLLPPPRAPQRSSFERPPRDRAPRRHSPDRSGTPRAPRVVASSDVPEPGGVERVAPDRPAQVGEVREGGPGRGRRRRGRRGRGRAKPADVALDSAAQVPLRPNSGAALEAVGDGPAPRPMAVSSDPGAPKKYKGVVVLSIGLPGSGKSSWFKRNNITPLSSDLLRGLLFDDPNEQRFQDLVFSNLRSLLRARLVARRPMNYVDATNLSPHERQGWIKLAHDYGYEVHAVYFDVPLDVCLDRNRKRQRVVAEDVMRRMGGKLQAPTFEEGFTKITNVRVKRKEAEDAAPAAEMASDATAEVLDMSASTETPEEIGVASESVE